MFIIDGHLDLAYNALKYGRNLLLPVDEIRRTEAGSTLPNGRAMVSFPALQDAGVALVFGTIFTEPAKKRFSAEKELFVYRDADEAYAYGQSQLDYYHRIADNVETIKLVGDKKTLESVVASHNPREKPLLGIIPLMEGADPIREPAEAELWFERGLRLIGLAWDDTRYSAGAWRGNGGLTSEGRRLLEIMADLGFVLDLTHMSEEATLQALDLYEGSVVATHSNARSLVPGQRQLGDLQIRRLAEQGGVIGIVLSNGFLKASYRRGDPKEEVTLNHVAAHIDHICQCVGDALHVGIGSDFDGGFGAESAPAGMETIADLPLIAAALKEYGYDPIDIGNIMGGNWLNLLRRSLPE